MNINIKTGITLLNWVQINHPEVIAFKPDNQTVRKLQLAYEVNGESTWQSVIMMYGILFTLASVEFFATREEYEVCEIALRAIKWLNENSNTVYPFHLGDEKVKEFLGKSPKEILDKLEITPAGSELTWKMYI